MFIPHFTIYDDSNPRWSRWIKRLTGTIRTMKKLKEKIPIELTRKIKSSLNVTANWWKSERKWQIYLNAPKFHILHFEHLQQRNWGAETPGRLPQGRETTKVSEQITPGSRTTHEQASEHMFAFTRVQTHKSKQWKMPSFALKNAKNASWMAVSVLLRAHQTHHLPGRPGIWGDSGSTGW